MANISDLPQPKASVKSLEVTIYELITFGELITAVQDDDWQLTIKAERAASVYEGLISHIQKRNGILSESQRYIQKLEDQLNRYPEDIELMIKELDKARQSLYIAGIPHERLV